MEQGSSASHSKALTSGRENYLVPHMPWLYLTNHRHPTVSYFKPIVPPKQYLRLPKPSGSSQELRLENKVELDE